MDMFDAKRRDILDFEKFMDLKKPGFGGPSSAEAWLGKDGKPKTEKRLAGYQRTVERHAAFDHPHYNSTYKAMTHDIVYKQEGKKPFTYTDPYQTAMPVIQYNFTNEGMAHETFDSFINEQVGGEQVVGLRGKTDKDAIGDAEEKMMRDLKLKWDNFHQTDGRVDYTDEDGDLVAYIDLKKRKLYVMPDAAQMSDEEHAELMAPSFDPDQPGSYYDSKRAEEEEEEDLPEIVGDEEEEEETLPEEPSEVEFGSSKIEDIEKRLRALETDEESELPPSEE